MSQLVITILGNTNSYLLLLVEGLRALGQHARLIVNRKDILHRLEGRHLEWAENSLERVSGCPSITIGIVEYA